MADKQEQPQEQPKGGDHIPTDTQEQEEEQDEQPKGLLSKIGDPIGTSLALGTRSAYPVSTTSWRDEYHTLPRFWCFLSY